MKEKSIEIDEKDMNSKNKIKENLSFNIYDIQTESEDKINVIENKNVEIEDKNNEIENHNNKIEKII